jgi:hypothetical protein
MSRNRPAPTCADLMLAAPCVLEPPAQVALEDYARVLTSAAAAEVIASNDTTVTGLHLCGLSTGVTPAALCDVQSFANELAAATPSGGLGWS